MKKFVRFFFSRFFWFIALVLVQAVLLLGLLFHLGVNFRTFQLVSMVLSYCIVLVIINNDDNPSYKLAWSIFILILPWVGGLFYLLFGGRKIPKQLRNNMLKRTQETFPLLTQDPVTLEHLNQEEGEAVTKQFRYVEEKGYFPVYEHTETQFCETGETQYRLMLEELKKAQHFIFIEYFIIHEGKFWNDILSILEEKAQAGVDVRVMFDDAGCLKTLPNHYPDSLRKKGIQCEVFNPLRPTLAVRMNNRDHRKICVIDNAVGFVGGINLADEYINEQIRFGHWKDTAVMMRGAATWSLTVTFLQFWNYLAKIEKDDYLRYKLPCPEVTSEGFVQPLSDSPTDSEPLALNIHMNLMNNAKKSVYIQTPYLVIDHDMLQTLIRTAKNGVDVRMILPHVPDKWYVHMLTQSNYQKLIEAGVRVYEYTPGFIHSKTVLCDDEIGLCGSINMDYRSYYMHYECGVLMAKTHAVQEMKEDYLKTLEQCVEVTLEEVRKTSFLKRLIQAILNLVSPLL